MDKLFSITCTTCRARLAVRDAAAIGAILECPKCHSMVQIIPPEGWKPPISQGPAAQEVARRETVVREGAEASQAAVSAGRALPSGAPPDLPPLSRVSRSAKLELDPAGGSWLGRLIRNKWFLQGVVPAVAVILTVIVYGTYFQNHSPRLKTSVAKTESRGAESRTEETQMPEKSSIVAGSDDKTPAKVEPPLVKPPIQEPSIQKPSIQKPSIQEPPIQEPSIKEPPIQEPPIKEPPAQKPETGEPAAVVKAANESVESPSAGMAESSPADEMPARPQPETADSPAINPQPAKVENEIKKVPPLVVNVEARLADPIVKLELTDVPLTKALDLLAAMSTLPITLDAEALAALGIGPRDPVSLSLPATDVGKALQAIAAAKGLSTAIDGGQVLVTTPPEFREAIRTVRYTVSDLTGNDRAAALALAALVRRMVAPDAWQARGGRGAIEADPDALIVVQTGDVHRQVLVFCEKLRIARHLPLRGRGDPKQFELASRWTRARKTLERPLTANFLQPTPLAKILAFLAQAADCEILVDRAALAADETSDRVEVSLSVQNQPLESVLANLLRPSGMDFRIIDAEVLQATSREAAEERLDLEFYPIGNLLAKGTVGPSLAEEIAAQIAPESWDDRGGRGAVAFDAPSQCLLVLQSQPVQRQIEQFLQTK